MKSQQIQYHTYITIISDSSNDCQLELFEEIQALLITVLQVINLVLFINKFYFIPSSNVM